MVAEVVVPLPVRMMMQVCMASGVEVVQQVVRHLACPIPQHHDAVKGQPQGSALCHGCKVNKKAATSGSLFREL